MGSNTITPLTSVAFSNLTTHPTTLSGYGITDAKIASGVITLGSNTITPLTSQSDIGFSQLPTMYWADVQISNQSNNNTSPQFGNLRLRPGSANYGSYLRFGDGNYAYIAELTDDELTYVVGSSDVHIFKVGSNTKMTIGSSSVDFANSISSSNLGSINGFNTLELTAGSSAGNGGGIYFHYNGGTSYSSVYLTETTKGILSVQGYGTTGLVVGDANNDYIQIGGIRLVYDYSNNALKVVGSDGSSAANFYATGGVSALGQSSGSSSAYYAYLTVGTELDVRGMAYFNDDICINVGGHDYVLDWNRCIELGILS